MKESELNNSKPIKNLIGYDFSFFVNIFICCCSSKYLNFVTFSNDLLAIFIL
jgi:hypothetical protein